MRPFEYAAPATLREAIRLLDVEGGAELLAGGTDLLSLMKNDVVRPARLVNLKSVAGPAAGGLRGIRTSAEGTRIGALVTLDQIATDPAAAGMRERFPALVTAAMGVTSPQIRTMGTVGGDLCQRPRCWYYRNGYGLLARDAQGRALVPSGDNRYHAILGNQGPAYFVHPSSLAPALIALDASVTIAGGSGNRTVRLAEFFRTPQTDTERENVLRAGEILTEVLIPAATGWQNAAYEVRQREALDWPLAAAAVAVQLSGGRVAAARIVMGHVAPVPWPAVEAARWLEGKPLDEATAAEAGNMAVRGARPLPMNKYKVQLARVSVKRALLAAAKGGA
jgi:xanthine dehydrogenase YagS FAD-binding subunit